MKFTFTASLNPALLSQFHTFPTPPEQLFQGPQEQTHPKATSTLVFGNLSNFVVVFEGVVFFSDPVFEAPLVFTGIALSLLGGVWYAIEQSDPADDGKISMNEAGAETASRCV